MKYLTAALFLILCSFPALATETGSLSVELYISKAEVNVEKGEFFKALTNYQVVIDEGMNSSAIHQQMSVLYYHLGFLDKAIKSSEKALKTVLDNDSLHHNLGLLYFVNNDLDKARKQFVKALEINPGSANAHYYLAHVLLRQNLPDIARMFAYSAKQLGHTASDILVSSDNQSQSPPLSVWVADHSKVYLRQIIVKERERSEEIMHRLEEGVLFEDIAHLEFDSPNGGYSGGFPLEDLQVRIVSSFSGKTILSTPIVVESGKNFTIIQNVAPVDWQQITPLFGSQTLDNSQGGLQASTTVDHVDKEKVKASSPVPNEKSLPYTVQIGAFREYKYAQQEIEKVNLLGYKGYLLETLKGGEVLYVAIAGGYPSRSAAEIAYFKLKSEGFDSFIITRKESP